LKWNRFKKAEHNYPSDDEDYNPTQEEKYIKHKKLRYEYPSEDDKDIPATL